MLPEDGTKVVFAHPDWPVPEFIDARPRARHPGAWRLLESQPGRFDVYDIARCGEQVALSRQQVDSLIATGRVAPGSF